MSQLVKASTALSEKHGLEPAMLVQTVKQQCFPTMRPENVSDEQCAMFLSVCHTQDLNPFIPGMVYAYPAKSGGITPVIGPDGVFKKLAEMKGVTFECEVFPEDVSQKPTHAKASIYCEGKERPATYTAIFSEWFVSNNPNWNTRPRHMLWLRAIKQCARQVIHGLPMDEDEVTLSGLKNVTGTSDDAAPEAPQRPAAPKRERGVSAAVAEKKTATEAAAVEVVASPVVEPAANSSPATPIPAAAAPVEVVTEAAPPVAEKKVEPAKPAAPATEKKPEPAKPVAAAPAAVMTKLADGQRVTFERVEVQQFSKKTINGKPSIEAELKGAYTGKVYHIEGSENPAWQIEKPVSMTLIGKKLTSGMVISLVEKLEVSSDAAGVELF